MNPTIKDVAVTANVSVATVSRVLNDLPGYSEETRQKVLQAITKLGYEPNALARGLVSKRSHTIGILMPSLSSMVASEILKGIEDTAHRSNQSVIVCNTDNDGKRTLEYLQVLQEKQVDGIIVVSANIIPEYYQKMMAMRKPVILVATKYPQSNLPFIKVDDEKAAYDATSYLIQKGHRIIGMLSGTRTDQIASTPRVKGYERALSDHGIPIRENYITYGDFSFKSGMICLERLLEATPEITAIFAASDEMAVGVLSQAFKMGIAVPRQLSVIGYDNTQIAEMTTPPLTALSQPFYEMGQSGIAMLLEQIEQGKKMESLIMPHRIAERDTVREIL
ncbi:MAG TPA: LacI family DNA-binding transcriptional regulator [Bacillota bacterium]